MASHPVGFWFALSLGAVSTLGGLSALVYAPSLPDMARDLATPIGMVQATLSGYLVSYGVFQLVSGALSDRFGRRAVLLVGSGLFVIASLLCAIATRVDLLIGARILQGAGACAGVAVARAIIRDVYGRRDTARLIALLSAFTAIVATSAPALGGYLQTNFGWRHIFAGSAAFGAAICILMIFTARETISERQTAGGLFRGSLRGFVELIRVPEFAALAAITAGSSACVYGYIAIAPVILIDGMGVSPDVAGYCIALQPGGFLLGSLISSRLAARFSLRSVIVVGLAGLVVIGATMALLAGDARAWVLAAPFAAFGFFHAFITNNSYAIAVSIQPRLAGSASGGIGFTQMAGGGLAIVVYAIVQFETVMPIAILMALTGTAGLLAIRRFAGGR